MTSIPAASARRASWTVATIATTLIPAPQHRRTRAISGRPSALLRTGTRSSRITSISVPIHRYDGTIIAAINMGAHVDRVSTGEMIDRFLPLLCEGAESVKSMLL